MTVGRAQVDVADVVKGMNITVTVTGRRFLGARILFATPLLRLAGWIIGCGQVEVRAA